METNTIKTKSGSIDKMVREVGYYLDPLITYFEELSYEEKLELKRSYGTGLRIRYWRTLQKNINKSRPDFNPNGMDKYWDDEAQAYNEESFKMIRGLEKFFKKDFKSKLIACYGDNWFKEGHP